MSHCTINIMDNYHRQVSVLFKLVVAVFLCLSIPGCSSLPPIQPADTVHKMPHTGGSALAFDSTSQVVASGGWEGRIWVWWLASGDRSHGWKAHDGNVNGIAFRSENAVIITAGRDGKLAEWEFSGEPIRHISTGNPIIRMVLDEPNQRVITGHKDGTVRIWSLEDLRLLDSKKIHRRTVLALAVQDGSDLIASSGSDGEVFIWKPGSKPRAMLGIHTDAWTLDFSPDGRWLMGAGWFRLFRWSVADGSFTGFRTKHRGIIKSIQYSDDGSYLASISRQTDSSVYFLDPDDGTVLKRFGRHELCGEFVVISPNGRYLATTADDAQLRIWDLQKQQ